MVFNVKMEELKSYAPFAPQTPRLRAGRAHRAPHFAVPQKMCNPGHRACWDRSAPEHCGSPGDYPAHVWNTGYRNIFLPEPKNSHHRRSLPLLLYLCGNSRKTVKSADSPKSKNLTWPECSEVMGKVRCFGLNP